MRTLLLAVSLFALSAVSACQTGSTDDPNRLTYSRGSANKAVTDDPIKALQRY